MGTKQSASVPTGTIYLSTTADAVVAVEDIVRYWTKGEVSKLLAGDQEARDELIASAAMKVWGSEVDVDHVDIVIEGRCL